MPGSATTGAPQALRAFRRQIAIRDRRRRGKGGPHRRDTQSVPQEVAASTKASGLKIQSQCASRENAKVWVADTDEEAETTRTLPISICPFALIALLAGCGGARSASPAPQADRAQASPPLPPVHPVPRHSNSIPRVQDHNCTLRAFREGPRSPLTIVQICFL